MNLGPRLNQPLLRSGKTAPDTLDRLDGEHGRSALIIRMEVEPVMRSAGLDEHANDDSKESRELWPCRSRSSSPNWVSG
jgi:hypothetical protein